MTRIILGPLGDLHRGVHHTLMSMPPSGIQYVPHHAEHTFLFPSSQTCAFTNPHWAELVSFKDPTAIVHSYHWPVLGHYSWVAEIDDLGYPLFGGRHAFSQEFRAAFPGAWEARFRRNVLCRATNMLRAFAHSSCKAILFHSQQALSEGVRWIQTLGLGSEADQLIAKSAVVYSAQRPCELGKLDKWDFFFSSPTIVFSGWEFETKNGQLALNVFANIAREFPHARFVYIGVIPTSAEYDRDALRGKIETYSSLPRGEVLRIFERSHVLFHPSRFEGGLANVLIEASANGMAVIVAQDQGMRSATELFGTGGAILINRDNLSISAEHAAFESALRALLSDSTVARSLAVHNRKVTSSGRLSIQARDQTLNTAYERSVSSATRQPLCVDDLPFVEGCLLRTLSTPEVLVAEDSFRRTRHMDIRRLIV